MSAEGSDLRKRPAVYASGRPAATSQCV